MDPPKKDEEEDSFTFTGKTLDADGNVESLESTTRTHRRTRVAARLDAPAPELELVERTKSLALELEARPQRAEADYVPPSAPARPGVSGGGLSAWPILLVIALMIGGAWYYFFGLPKRPAALTPIAVTVTITSEPSGAAVSVQGTRVGVTPWAVDNTWGPGPVNVNVTAPGYRPWSGTFPGGRPTRVEARLQRR
jgi:eukaryotic-like serine/threonine-protein kinase